MMRHRQPHPHGPPARHGALINRNPGFEIIRNSISPNHSWYGQAVEWGEAWLKGNGF
jgi:hypothetical protein